MRPLFKLWDTLPHTAEDERYTISSNNERENDNFLGESSFSHKEMALPDIQEDVNTSHNNKLITLKATVKLSKLYNDINQSSTISVFTKRHDNKDLKKPIKELKSLKNKFSPFVKTKSDKGTPQYIWRSTAV